MKMTSVKAGELKKQWFIVDAADQTVGRLASQIAYVLRGKHKGMYVPHLDCGDQVIVINAEKVKFTGQKWHKKIYYHHSTHIGGLKAKMAGAMLETHPERVIEHAVRGMIPRNKLGARQFGALKIYAGEKHPHEAQKPVPMVARIQKV